MGSDRQRGDAKTKAPSRPRCVSHVSQRCAALGQARTPGTRRQQSQPSWCASATPCPWRFATRHARRLSTLAFRPSHPPRGLHATLPPLSSFRRSGRRVFSPLPCSPCGPRHQSDKGDRRQGGRRSSDPDQTSRPWSFDVSLVIEPPARLPWCRAQPPTRGNHVSPTVTDVKRGDTATPSCAADRAVIAPLPFHVSTWHTSPSWELALHRQAYRNRS